MKKSDNVKAYFNKIAEVFSSNYIKSPEFKERYRVWEVLIEKYIPYLKSNNSICIDMGCGDGLMSRIVASKQIMTIGIDQSRNMLSIAQQSSVEEGIDSHVEYICASLPLSRSLEKKYKGTSNLIICSSVLEYVEDYEVILEQFHNLLNRNGILLISLPNSASLYRLYERFLKKIPFLAKDSYLRYQKHGFNPRDVKYIFNKLQFNVIEEKFYTLPYQKYTSRIFGNYRGRWIATMFLIAAQKK
jgi:2-polyprenyl-3-methyl-5-hydroxy-6-metoxy-1,4-benzoquinol methylase